MSEPMAEAAVVVDAVRTPVGRRGGALKDHHPVTLLAQTLRVLLERTRIEPDAFSLESHRRAAHAAYSGYFASQLATLPELDRDEGVRRDTSAEKLASLKPAFASGGVITAGNSSQISDGAAAVLITSQRFAHAHGLTPRARIVANTVVGDDPELMLTAVMPATRDVLRRADLRLEDIDLFEVNEAFASVVLAWTRETGVSCERVNVNGGAIAIGHPLGASGARLFTVLLNELERRRARYGLQTMCEGGGMANATIIERMQST